MDNESVQPLLQREYERGVRDGKQLAFSEIRAALTNVIPAPLASGKGVDSSEFRYLGELSKDGK